MTPEQRDDLEQELAELRKRFDPAHWRGEPKEIVRAFDDVARYYEGDAGKKIRRGAEQYLHDRDQKSALSEVATRAIIATDGQQARRIQELNQDEGWKQERRRIQNTHDLNTEQVAQRVNRVRAEVARANGIDVEKTRVEMLQDERAAARAKVGKARERPPQELSVWDAAERRNARQGIGDYEPGM